MPHELEFLVWLEHLIEKDFYRPHSDNQSLFWKCKTSIIEREKPQTGPPFTKQILKLNTSSRTKNQE